jgi:hypothetical protein
MQDYQLRENLLLEQNIGEYMMLVLAGCRDILDALKLFKLRQANHKILKNNVECPSWH